MNGNKDGDSLVVDIVFNSIFHSLKLPLKRNIKDG
jgi:hypothetical protein